MPTVNDMDLLETICDDQARSLRNMARSIAHTLGASSDDGHKVTWRYTHPESKLAITHVEYRRRSDDLLLGEELMVCAAGRTVLANQYNDEALEWRYHKGDWERSIENIYATISPRRA